MVLRTHPAMQSQVIIFKGPIQGIRLLLGTYPDSKVCVANMGPTWVLAAPGGPHVGPMNFAIRLPAMMHISCGALYLETWLCPCTGVYACLSLLRWFRHNCSAVYRLHMSCIVWLDDINEVFICFGVYIAAIVLIFLVQKSPFHPYNYTLCY